MKIALCGYLGKMGSSAYELLKEYYHVIGIEKNDNLENYDFDLLIDFTNFKSAYKNILYCINKKIDFICGTTGFDNQQISFIKERCKENNINGVICYNFSLPINFLLSNSKIIGEYFDNLNYYDFHNKNKIDKISGTNYLFKEKYPTIHTKSIQNDKKNITYVITLQGKYDKISLTYQVNNRKAYALGLLSYLQGNKESIINILND